MRRTRPARPTSFPPRQLWHSLHGPSPFINQPKRLISFGCYTVGIYAYLWLMQFYGAYTLRKRYQLRGL